MCRVFIFLFISNFIFAQPAMAEVRCPDISKLHEVAEQAIEATLVQDAYIANTEPLSIHTKDGGWFAVVYHIEASSKTEAVEMARSILRQVRTQPLYARYLADSYVCDYEYGKVQVLSNEEPDPY